MVQYSLMKCDDFVNGERCQETKFNREDYIIDEKLVKVNFRCIQSPQFKETFCVSVTSIWYNKNGTPHFSINIEGKLIIWESRTNTYEIWELKNGQHTQ